MAPFRRKNNPRQSYQGRNEQKNKRYVGKSKMRNNTNSSVSLSENPRLPARLRLGDVKNGKTLRTRDRVDLKISLRRQNQNNPSSYQKKKLSPNISKRLGNSKSVDRNNKNGMSSEGYNVTIGNLNTTVTLQDVKELCASVGPIISARFLHPGTALVKFQERQDAIETLKKYNNVKLDNSKLMISLLN